MYSVEGKARVQEYLEKKLKIPGRDLGELPTSKKRFPKGEHYKIYGPGMQSPEALEALLKAAKEYKVTINRIGQSRGIMRLTDDEILRMKNIVKENGSEIFMMPGPRATYDISAQAKTGTAEAGRIGYHLRGSDQLVRAILDIMRGIDLGIRGFHALDEGFLYVVCKMRKDGLIPPDVQFKVSAHTGHGNAATVKMLAELGADSVNPVRDLTLPIIASIRAAVDVPIEIHVDNPESTGGFIRTFEAPEMVRIGAPMVLKCGASVYKTHAWATTPEDARMVAKQASLAQRMVEKFFPEATQVQPFAEHMALPK